MEKKAKYNRILLKLSGEALLGEQSFGMDPKVLHFIADEIQSIKQYGVEVVIVIGAGNIWRGTRNNSDIDRVPSDYMGMLGTIMNSLALQSTLEKKGIYCRCCSAIDMPEVAEPYITRRADRHLEKGRVVICAAGTGNPYFTTDSAAALRALELKCDILLKATNVDGVYDSDPRTNTNAQKYETVSFDEVLEKSLKVMDSTAIAQCRDNQMPIQVFKLMEKGNLEKVIQGESVGTNIVFTEN